MVMEKYELQKLRDLPIEGGLTVKMHKSLCPFHDDHHASMSFKVSKNTYRCFVCGASGGTIDLVMRHLNFDFKAACRWLADENNVILEEWKPQTSDISPQTSFDASRYERFFERPWLNEEARRFLFEERRLDPRVVERFFERPWLNEEARRFLFEERRLDPRVVRWCRLTSWKDKQGVPWLQIPYYDREGKLVGIQNRNLVRGALPRFRFPQGSECGIYNLPVLNLLRPGEQLFITEGCSDCWAMLSSGHKAIAIPSATLLTNDVRGKMEEVRDKLDIQFHMYPDRDEPGERLFLQLQKVLPSLVHHQLPPDCKDFSDFYTLNIKH